MANINSFNSGAENGYGWRAVVPATSANLGAPLTAEDWRSSCT